MLEMKKLDIGGVEKAFAGTKPAKKKRSRDPVDEISTLIQGSTVRTGGFGAQASP